MTRSAALALTVLALSAAATLTAGRVDPLTDLPPSEAWDAQKALLRNAETTPA